MGGATAPAPPPLGHATDICLIYVPKIFFQIIIHSCNLVIGFSRRLRLIKKYYEQNRKENLLNFTRSAIIFLINIDK